MRATPEQIKRAYVQECREWYAHAFSQGNMVECVKAARAVDAAEGQLKFLLGIPNPHGN